MGTLVQIMAGIDELPVLSPVIGPPKHPRRRWHSVPWDSITGFYQGVDASRIVGSHSDGDLPEGSWRLEAMPRAGEALEMARIRLEGPSPRSWVAKRLHPRLLRERELYPRLIHLLRDRVEEHFPTLKFTTSTEWQPPPAFPGDGLDAQGSLRLVSAVAPAGGAGHVGDAAGEALPPNVFPFPRSASAEPIDVELRRRRVRRQREERQAEAAQPDGFTGRQWSRLSLRFVGRQNTRRARRARIQPARPNAFCWSSAWSARSLRSRDSTTETW